MSFFFNADFEDFLASDALNYQIHSNRKNQELEYFILWLENEALYSLKQYDNEFLEFIEHVKGTKVKVSSRKDNVKLWCQNLEDTALQKKLNSKLTSAECAIRNKFAHPETKIISKGTPVLDQLIYKEPFGVSGIGTWTGRLHKKVIEQRLSQSQLIAEPLLDRTFDIGCCVLEDKDFYYQCHVDEYFQFKGCTLGLGLEKLSWFNDYKSKLEIIKRYYKQLGIVPPYSIDSFLYKEGGVEKIYILGEVNARKTMGFIAINLWKKYYKDQRYFTLKLIHAKNIKNHLPHLKIYNYFDGFVIPLSPFKNVFFTYAIAANSLHELCEVEDDLSKMIY